RLEELVHASVVFCMECAVSVIGGLARREVRRVDRREEEVEGGRAAVLDLHPHRLDALGLEIDAEVLPALGRSEGGDADADGSLRLGADPRAEGRPVRRPGVIGGAADQQPGRTEPDPECADAQPPTSTTYMSGLRRSPAEKVLHVGYPFSEG